MRTRIAPRSWSKIAVVVSMCSLVGCIEPDWETDEWLDDEVSQETQSLGRLPAWTPRLNRTYNRASHNSYENPGLYPIATVLDWAKAVELDLVADYGDSNNWVVAHDVDSYGIPKSTSDAVAVCGNKWDQSCFSAIKSYMDNHQTGAFIALWIDIKDAGSWECAYGNGCRGPERLDNLIDVYLLGTCVGCSSDRLLKPADLRAAQYSIRQGVAHTGGWPRTEALKGKIAVFLTSDREDNSRLSYYVDKRGYHARAFVAPSATKASHISGTPSGFTSTTAGHVVAYNFPWYSGVGDHCSSSACSQVALASNHNYVTRLWDVDDFGEYRYPIDHTEQPTYLAIDQFWLNWMYPFDPSGWY